MTSEPEFYHLNQSEVANVPLAKDKRVQFLADANHDLAILRVPLDAGTAMSEVALETKRASARSTAFGFGYGIFAISSLHAATMRVGTTVSASSYLVDGAKDKYWDVLQATRDRFASGMSGGPLLAKVEAEYRLVGIMFATDSNGAELTIPADYVAPLLERALKLKDKMEELTAKNAAGITVPFSEDVKKRFGGIGRRDEVEWSGLSSWVEAFSSAAGFRERFQEVVIRDLVAAGGAVPTLTFRVHPDAVREGERVEVWVNGRRAIFPRKELGAERWELKIGKDLLAGDNLLSVRKVSRRQQSTTLEIMDFFRTNPLGFTLSGEGGAAYVVRRSLPAIVDTYTVYVTLRRPEAKREKFLRDDEQIRLAVRVDAIERFLNGVPFLLPLAESMAGPDKKPVARATALVAVAANDREVKDWRPGQFVRLDVQSGGTVDISVRGRIAQFKADVAGVQIGFDKPGQTLPFEFRSRLNFLRQEGTGQFHVTMRTTAATSDGEFKVPLLVTQGVRVQADLAGLGTELGLQWVNNNYLKPEEPRVLSQERLGRLLAEIGGSGEGLDAAMVLRRAFVTQSVGHDWLIVTCGIQDKKSTEGSPKLPLLPAGNDGRIVDVVGRDVPAALAAEFARTWPSAPSDERHPRGGTGRVGVLADAAEGLVGLP